MSEEEEGTLKRVAHKWLKYLGYTDEQIAEGEKPTDHKDCEFDGQSWFCFDENGISHHELQDEIGEQITVAVEIMEFAWEEIPSALISRLTEGVEGLQRYMVVPGFGLRYDDDNGRLILRAEVLALIAEVGK